MRLNNMGKYLFIKHSKTSITPLLFLSYNFDKLINFYKQDCDDDSLVTFIYSFDERLMVFVPVGHCIKGLFIPCTSDMFNFERFINA